MEIRIIDNNCEFITVSLLRLVSKTVSENQEVMISLLGDESFVKKYGREPLKTEEERIQMAAAIKGVDYVHNLSTGEIQCVKNYDKDTQKEFHVGYIPGSYDLFHPGHLEIISIARQQCEIVILGVNSDNHVWTNKKKVPKQNQNTRMHILNHIKGVDGVILVETNDKTVANNLIIEMTGFPINVIYYGQDLQGKEINDEGGLNVNSIYTPRSETKMKRVSSSAERQELEKLKSENVELKKKNDDLASLLDDIQEQVE